MVFITPLLQIPETEFTWSFARSGGPGGQNVNKVASKAVLRWHIAASSALAEDVKIRLALQQKRFFTQDGELIIMSQKYRDQERNRQDCLEKLRAMILQAATLPKKRKPMKPSRGAKEARLRVKKKRSQVKQGRRVALEG